MKKDENEDIVIEDDPDSTSPADIQKKLREKVKQAEAKAKEYMDGWQRSQADFVNLRRRDEEAKAEFLKFAHADMVSQLLPVLDSFELSLPHGNKDLPAGQGQAGLEVIYKQFLSILKSGGLEVSNPMGETFDPKMHEAIGVIETEKSGDDHKILEVVQKGYILSGKTIRPAKVRIGEFINNK